MQNMVLLRQEHSIVIIRLTKPLAGSFVRIGPNEIHISDPGCYDSILNFDPDIEKAGALGHRLPIGGTLI